MSSEGHSFELGDPLAAARASIIRDGSGDLSGILTQEQAELVKRIMNLKTPDERPIRGPGVPISTLPDPKKH
jgi:hypothetical protein